MKKIPAKYIILSGLAIALGGIFHACSEEQVNTPERVDGKSGIVFRTGFREGTSGNGLLTKLYVFSTDDTGGYSLADSLPQVISGTTRLKINPADLSVKDYRFLFVATPEAKPEIQVKCANHSPFSFGTKWEEVVIEMSKDSLSVDNYYGIKELKGQEILNSGIIEAELNRLVGQMVFCFYKAGPGGVKDPVAVDDKTVASVMDRISSINITYKNVPRQIKFNADNLPVVQEGSETTVEHTVAFSLSTEGQKVALPQTGVPVEVADSIGGGAILKGTCLLPTRQGVRVSMVFNYYDTTPKCGDTGHTHGTDCYTPKTLSLQLPQNAEAPGLSVLSDHFTINNAGLPCNRIIDVQHTSGIDVIMGWN